MVVVKVLSGLVGRNDDLVGVDDDDVVTRVHVGGEEGAMLAAQQRRGDGRHASENQALGVDDQPLAGQLGGLG